MKSIKIFSLLLLFACVFSMGSIAKADDQIKIGYTVQDLTNPIWAATAEELHNICEQKGWSIVTLDCDENASKQITQLENFIELGVNGIIVHAADVEAIDPTIVKAMEKGIKVMSYGQTINHCDADYNVENYKLGTAIGTEAAKWINEKLGGEAEVGILDFPVNPDIIARANGIIDAIKKDAPKAKIVATASAVTAIKGLEAGENFLQAHPDMKVIACIGDGGAIGANEAVKAAGMDTPDFGIFSADATEEAKAKIAAGEPLRMSIQIGTPRSKAELMVKAMTNLIEGKPQDKVFYDELIPIDASNVNKNM